MEQKLEEEIISLQKELNRIENNLNEIENNLGNTSNINTRMSSCNHLFVKDNYYDIDNNQTIELLYCVKCNLNNYYRVLNSGHNMQQIFNNTCNNGMKVNLYGVDCDFVRKVVKDICKSFVNISNEEIVNFLNMLFNCSNSKIAPFVNKNAAKTIQPKIKIKTK